MSQNRSSLVLKLQTATFSARIISIKIVLNHIFHIEYMMIIASLLAILQIIGCITKFLLSRGFKRLTTFKKKHRKCVNDFVQYCTFVSLIIGLKVKCVFYEHFYQSSHIFPVFKTALTIVTCKRLLRACKLTAALHYFCNQS